MKRLIPFVLASLFLFAGCDKEGTGSILAIDSISGEVFDCNGGLGSIILSGASEGLNAESSEPEWLRVQVRKNTVLFNVVGYEGKEDRSATITVSSENNQSVTATITQTKFVGIKVLVRSLEFSNDNREQIVEVTASGEYTVTISDDPSESFGFRKVPEGVCFTTSKSQGHADIEARATLKLVDGDEPVVIKLVLPKKNIFEYLTGTWTVKRCENSNLKTVNFETRVPSESLDAYFEMSPVSEYPVRVNFEDGKLVMVSGQKLGSDGSKYYSLHYNGPINGEGTYIFSDYGRVAWAAEPIFDWENKEVTLVFSDNGQGGSNVARTFAIWGCSDYFNFNDGSSILVTDELVLTKTITE